MATLDATRQLRVILCAQRETPHANRRQAGARVSDHRSTARIALLLLFFVSLFNYMDRFALSVLLPSIKESLEFSDTELGAVTTAFTISYVLFGIPLARLADRYNRKRIISAALATWSLMTAACGLAQNFAQLAIARVLVGVGESGATPPAHSLLADYFPISQRSKAIAIFSVGAPIGLMIGFALAGWIAETYSWRVAFFSLGLPGLLLAALLLAKLKEPERGQADGEAVHADSVLPFLSVIKLLLSKPAYRHICFATGLYTVVYLGVVGWLPSYFVRSFDMSVADVGFWLALSLGIPQIVGMLTCGAITDRLVVRDLRWYGRIPALAMALSTPLFLVVFLTDNVLVASTALFLAFFIGIFQGPASLTAIQGLAELRTRALAAAVFFLIVNLIGGGVGPLLTGWLSDRLAADYGADSLRYALLGLSIVFGFWSAIHYALATRTLEAGIRANRRADPRAANGA